jgi:alkylation response protein AidB-like acyl-CoA dehydrogenase
VLRELTRYCRAVERGGRPLADDPVVRKQLADLAIGVEAEQLLWYEGQCEYGFHLHSAIMKEFQPEFAQTCMEILGPLGQIQDGEWAPLAGEIDRVYRRSFGNHAGGTSQVKRMVVATRALGLPRSGQRPCRSTSRSTTTN